MKTIREVCVLIKGINYQRKEINLVLLEENEVFFIPRIDNHEEYSSIYYCKELVKAVTGFKAEGWLNFSLIALKDDPLRTHDGDRCISYYYQCVIPYETELKIGKWFSFQSVLEALASQKKKSFLGELKDVVL